MKKFITSMAIVATCSLGMTITPGMAAPFGASPKQPAGKANVTPVSFLFDTNQGVLYTAFDGFYYQLQDDGQGGLLIVDVNGIPWTIDLCCRLGQVDFGQGPVYVVGGLLAENTGQYGAPLVYDGGFNLPFTPQQ